MVMFWIVAAVLSAVASIAVLAAGAAAARSVPAENLALAIHRRELVEIDDLTERGVLAPVERDVLRAEAARRLLAAADEPVAVGTVSGKADRITVPAIAAAAPLLAVAIYCLVGSPGYADQPFLQRVSGWRAADPRTLTAAQMAAALELIVKERLGDPEPLRALGIVQMASGQYAPAQINLRKAVDLAPRRADLWAGLGEAFAGEADGTVTADAAAAFDQALKLDPSNAPARYYLGRAALAAGDKPAALAQWRAVLATLPQGDPRRAPLLAEMASAETGALVPGTGGPSAAQVTAAQGQVGGAQIRAMVAGLAARLASSPDDADGWVRLVRAYGVLGDTAKRDAALKAARAHFAGKSDILKALDAVAAPSGAGGASR